VAAASAAMMGCVQRMKDASTRLYLTVDELVPVREVHLYLCQQREVLTVRQYEDAWHAVRREQERMKNEKDET
jgi:hypothetical protein